MYSLDLLRQDPEVCDHLSLKLRKFPAHSERTSEPLDISEYSTFEPIPNSVLPLQGL